MIGSIIRFIVIAICSVSLLGCSSAKINTVSYNVRQVELVCSATPDERYADLNHGINLMVASDVKTDEIIDNRYLSTKEKLLNSDKYEFTPTVKEFVAHSLGVYLRSAGIKLGRDRESDYILRVRVKEFKIIQGSTPRATVVLDYTLSNPDNEVILQQTARGRYSYHSQMSVAALLDKAYSKALAEVDLDGIAAALGIRKRPEQEPTKSVKGDGNTALEHTVIRWYIVSTPAGADVSWRVVSSTPEVKNNNSVYVGTTPYETTESFDIRGLSWENSGNVQIEVSCDKAGYLPQKRRFNLRQAIEQKEISAKFNLVKDE